MKFRRSAKHEKHDSAKPVQISIPQKDAIAIEAPKKVIKALYDYNAPAEPKIYLSFSAGDFLHVLSREDDTDWYEACNPLAGTRGLVPVNYFEEIGKTVRDSKGSSASMSATHDSGYAEGAAPASRSVATSRASMVNGSGGDMHSMPGHRSSKSVSRALGGVYGVVSYDFNAERPDELDAKEGEAIIVIAQSNPEWFVAKPITRLGGPGLIPVSFIEIRDMTTGKPVDDPVAAVAKAGIPRVEEWKKMAAEYKNTSIPLGTVSSSQQAQQMQQNMDRLSLNSGRHQNGFGQARPTSNYAYQQQQQQNLFAPERASVPRYIYADDKFHFIVECRLSNGTHWDLSRVYEDFYELQINLINAFPEEAGQTPGKPRILPYMPGPVKYVTDNISEGRRANLDEYLRDLLRLNHAVTNSSLVRNFFAPRGGDYEVDPVAVDIDLHARPAEPRDRYSQASQGSHPNGGQIRQAAQPAMQSQQQSQPYVHTPPSSDPNVHQRSETSTTNSTTTNPPQSHYRSPSEYTHQSHTSLLAPSLTPSNQTTTTPPTSIAPATTNPSSTSSATAPVKVKAWFDRDTCVVIRMPPRGHFTFDDLHRKIVERRRLEYKGEDRGDEDLEIEYRDERDGEYYRLEGEEDLEIAAERNEKLTLAVRAAAGS